MTLAALDGTVLACNDKLAKKAEGQNESCVFKHAVQKSVPTDSLIPLKVFELVVNLKRIYLVERKTV